MKIYQYIKKVKINLASPDNPAFKYFFHPFKVSPKSRYRIWIKDYTYCHNSYRGCSVSSNDSYANWHFIINNEAGNNAGHHSNVTKKLENSENTDIETLKYFTQALLFCLKTTVKIEMLLVENQISLLLIPISAL